MGTKIVKKQGDATHIRQDTVVSFDGVIARLARSIFYISYIFPVIDIVKAGAVVDGDLKQPFAGGISRIRNLRSLELG